MTTTSQPTDQPTGQLITDEKSLERIFRERYPRFLADAKSRLGADHAAAAPRVVSKAFHNAWNERKRFHSMDELDAYLGANIQHGAARELSRLAGLHRIDAHAAPGAQKAQHGVADMSVDEAWERLQHTLQGGAPEAYRARASTARHEAAEHVAQLAQKRNWKPYAIIGGVGLVVAVTGVWWISKLGESRAIDHALSASNARGYETGAGQQINVTLDDGTSVRVGPQSKLTVPNRFGMSGGYRAVKIDGTANFTVTRTLKQPFEVRTGQVALVAHGTEFTVRRFQDDPSLIVYVRDGRVDLRLGDETRTINKGMGYAVTGAGAMRVPTSEELDEARTWVDGNVTIVGHTLRYVLPQLKRWYGLDVHVPDASLLDRKVFVRAAVDSPKEAISSIEESGGLKFTYIGENMAFQDKATAPATKTSTKTKTATKRR